MSEIIHETWIISVAVGCLLNAIFHVAVIRDKDIPEHEVIDALRKARAGAWLITGAVFFFYPWPPSYPSVVMLLPMSMFVITDMAAALLRLYPAMIDGLRKVSR